MRRFSSVRVKTIIDQELGSDDGSLNGDSSANHFLLSLQINSLAPLGLFSFFARFLLCVLFVFIQLFSSALGERTSNVRLLEVMLLR